VRGRLWRGEARGIGRLRRRMRLARMEAHLSAPDARLGAADKGWAKRCAKRRKPKPAAEIVDGQLEVF